MNKKTKKRFGIQSRLLLIALVPALLISVVVILFAKQSMTDGLYKEALDGLYMLAEAVNGGFNGLPGEYHLDGEELYKGDRNLTADLELIDSYVHGSDVDVTIFYGKTRRVTSLVDTASGQRITGTDASDEVWNEVAGGRTYTSTELVVNGKDYFASYLPLRDDSGNIIGMVFAGRPSEDVQKFVQGKVRNFTILTVVMLILSAMAGMFFAASIAKALVSAQKTLLELADGKLTTEVEDVVLKRSDEIGDMGRAENSLIEKLRTIVGKLLATSDELNQTGISLGSMAASTTNATEEISRAVEDISKGAVSQAEEIESASTEISSMGELISAIVDRVNNLAETSGVMSEAGEASSRTMADLSASNDRTSAAITTIGKQIRLTDESINRISAATELITTIASQTNLLSLNASIESARAGEAGRGFAVVATEIQKLSVQSNDAAVEIQKIIDALQTESAKTMREMQEAEVLMREQQSKLDETKGKFNEVSEGITVSREGTEHIHESADSCNTARATVMDIVSNLSAISEENAASSEETSASMQELDATISLLATKAESLQQIAQELNEEMKFFKM